jgi:type IV secretory pathway TraG/TraD family ATPase VirD4
MKSYKIYQLLKTERKLMLSMHLSILKVLFIVQVSVLVIAFIMCTGSIRQVDKSTTLRSDRKPPVSLRSFNLQTRLEYLLDLPALRPFKYALYWSFAVYPVIWPAVIVISRRRIARFHNKTVRGARMVTEQQFQKLLPKAGPSLKLTPDIVIPRDYETRHFFVCGASGTGKTTLFMQVIEHLRERDEKVIIYDRKDGEFGAKFYDPVKDVIFNPFDSRSMFWNVLDGKTSGADWDALAASVVPAATGKDKFFNDAARDVLSAIFRYCSYQRKTTNDDIWQVLCQPVPQLHSTLLGIRSEAASYLLNHYSGQTHAKEPFDLQEWITDDRRKGFIFLTNNTKQRQTLKGILAVFVNSAANEILSLRDDPDRRIFLIVDEFGTLQRMDAIRDLLVLGRSKGVSFWIGIQNKELLDAIYSREIADTLVNNCNNYVIFRCNGYYTAQYMSDLLGEAERDFSLALSNKDLTSGEAYRNMTKIDKVLLPSEIQALDDLHIYLKLYGLPITTTGFHYQAYPDMAPAFIPNPHFLSDKAATQAQDQHIVPGEQPPEENAQKPENESGKLPQQGFSIDDFNF